MKFYTQMGGRERKVQLIMTRCINLCETGGRTDREEKLPSEVLIVERERGVEEKMSREGGSENGGGGDILHVDTTSAWLLCLLFVAMATHRGAEEVMSQPTTVSYSVWSRDCD